MRSLRIKLTTPRYLQPFRTKDCKVVAPHVPLTAYHPANRETDISLVDRLSANQSFVVELTA